MPTTKKSTRRRRRRPQNRRLKAKNLDRRIRKLERSEELKYHDLQSTSALATTGTSIHLTGLAQGDDFDQRIGEEIVAKYLNMKLRFETSNLSVSSSQMRVLLFWDLQNNGVGPDVSTSVSIGTAVLDNATVTSTILCPHNYRTKHRYKILMDRVYNMNPDGTGVGKSLFVKRNLRLNGAKIKYQDSGATFASVTSRALWFMIIGNGSAVTDVTPTLSFRTWYTDA